LAGFDQPRPTLVRLLEAVAAIIDVEDGRLELIFRHGRLEAWCVDGGLRMPPDLAAHDAAAEQLVARTRLAGAGDHKTTPGCCSR
jgi:hypothetical protein